MATNLLWKEHPKINTSDENENKSDTAIFVDECINPGIRNGCINSQANLKGCTCSPGSNAAMADDTRLIRYVSKICSQIACDVASNFIMGRQRKIEAETLGREVNEEKICSMEQQDVKQSRNKEASESILLKTEDTGIIGMSSRQVGHFADIGIDADTVNMMCKSNIPVDDIFRANVPKHKAVEIPTEWQQFIGKDKIVGNWCDIMADTFKKYNMFCTFVFKGNHVSPLESRKRNSPLLRGFAVCAHRPTCTAEVHFTVTKEKRKTLLLSFKGEIIHDIRTTHARRIVGEIRRRKRQYFERNPRLPPSDVYREECTALNLNAFAAGNRT